MRAHDIMGVPAEFIEPSFAALTDEPYTGLVLSLPGEEALIVADPEDWPLALAVRDGQRWSAATFLLRPPVVEVVEKFEELGGDVVRAGRDEWMLAMRDYYSRRILAETPPAMEDLSPDRADKVRDLIASVWKDRRGEECFDCGCGTGMGSMVLRDLGMVPLAYDNDAGLIAQGLRRGRLLPERTMCIDAGLLSRYAPPAPLGLALMAGTIRDHTTAMWEVILGELFDMTEECLVTVETAPEAELVRRWAADADKRAEVFENERDTFYDRWACLVR